MGDFRIAGGVDASEAIDGFVVVAFYLLTQNKAIAVLRVGVFHQGPFRFEIVLQFFEGGGFFPLR